MSHYKFVNNKMFVLVLSSSKLWKSFCSKVPTLSPDQVYQVMAQIKPENWQSPPNSEDLFDVLLWVESTFVTDLDLEDWYVMFEFYSSTDLQLLQYFSSQPDQSPVAPSNKFDMKQFDKPIEKFIEENTAKNTIRSNTTALNLFNAFLTEMFSADVNVDNVEREKLPNIVAKYFMSIQKDDGEPYNASSLQVYYQSLGRILSERRKINIKGPEYDEVRKVLLRKQKMSCESGAIPGKNKSQAIPAKMLAKCWASGHLGSSNPRSLIAAVLLHIQMSFGTRAKTELHAIRNCDIEVGPLREDGVPSYLALGERVTKTRRGIQGQGKIFYYILLY